MSISCYPNLDSLWKLVNFSVKNLFLSKCPNPFFFPLIVSDQRANQWMDLFSVN